MEIKRIMILLSIFFSMYCSANANYADFVSGGEPYNYTSTISYTGTNIFTSFTFTGVLYIKEISCLNNNDLSNYSTYLQYLVSDNLTFNNSFSNTGNRYKYLRFITNGLHQTNVNQFFSGSLYTTFRTNTNTFSTNPAYTGSYQTVSCKIDGILFPTKPDMQKIEIVKNIPLEVQDYGLSIINFLVIILIFLSPFIYFWIIVREKNKKNALLSNPPKNDK